MDEGKNQTVIPNNVSLRIPKHEIPTVIELIEKHGMTLSDAKRTIFEVGSELFNRNPEEFFMILKTMKNNR